MFRGWQDAWHWDCQGKSVWIDAGLEVLKDLDQVGLTFQGVAGTQGGPDFGEQNPSEEYQS